MRRTKVINELQVKAVILLNGNKGEGVVLYMIFMCGGEGRGERYQQGVKV